MAEATKEKKPGRVAKFFRDYKSELKKITWCPFKSVKNSTAIVVAFTVILAAIILLIFLRDPLAPKPHEPDVNDVVRLCDIHNIPMATNLATAELLVKALDRGDMEWREMYK